MQGSRLTIADKLLIAALDLEGRGKKSFSAEDLVVSGWRNFPEAFGLRGYLGDGNTPIYPDSNRVYAEIMGSKPLRKFGYLRRVGHKMYSLTEAGRVRAREIADGGASDSSDRWGFGREKADHMIRLFESKAAQKYRSGNSEDITFFDACGFWGISPRSRAKDLWSRFAEIEATLSDAGRAVASHNGSSSRHGGTVLREEDILSLSDLHSYLQTRFKEDVDCIRKRNDERK